MKIPQGLLEKLLLPQKKILIFPPGNQLIFLHKKRYSDSETLKKCAQLFQYSFHLAQILGSLLAGFTLHPLAAASPESLRPPGPETDGRNEAPLTSKEN